MALALVACSSPGPGPSTRPARDGYPSQPPRDVMSIPDAAPKLEPRSRYGNPKNYVVFGKRYHVLPTSQGYVERGIASWYGTKFHGNRTSSGESYDMYAMTAAHKTLPLPTYARVTNITNGRSVVVKINDRGPFHDNRVIDLSYTAAAKLGILGQGTGLVEVRALDPLQNPHQNPRPADPGPRVIETRQAPPAAVVPPVTATPLPSTLTTPGLYLQIGAFVSRDNAEQLRAKLSQVKIPDIQIREDQRNARPVYQVRIGPLASVDEADRMATALERYGITNPHVVID